MIVQLVSCWYQDSSRLLFSSAVRHPTVAGLHPVQVIGHWSVFQPWLMSCELMNAVSVSCILVSGIWASCWPNRGELSGQISRTSPLSYTNSLCRTWYCLLVGHGSGPCCFEQDARLIAIAIVINLFILFCFVISSSRHESMRHRHRHMQSCTTRNIDRGPRGYH